MNYNLKVRRCKKCVMPEIKGVFDLDENGICQICSKYQCITENDGITFDEKPAEEKIQILKRKIQKMLRPDRKYDCAVAVSGGKDSIMTLYIAVKQLGLKPLAIFIDNGFALDQMYSNVRNATDILGVDLVIYKTSDVADMFRMFLRSGKKFYYCRACHALLDLSINRICKQNNINVVLGGYTKGQQYIKNTELFKIYNESDENTVELFNKSERFNEYCDLFANQNKYFRQHYGDIIHISPFKYVEWNEKNILETLKNELKFALPERSWPDKSSNCTFNYVSQYLVMKQFGFAQHESELSGQIRSGELTRERALEIIETPIETEDLRGPIEKLGLTLADIGINE